MAFPLRLLNEEEDIVLDLHPHWWFFTGPASLLALAAAGLVALMASDLPEALTMVVAALTVVMLVWLVGRYLR